MELFLILESTTGAILHASKLPCSSPLRVHPHFLPSICPSLLFSHHVCFYSSCISFKFTITFFFQFTALWIARNRITQFVFKKKVYEKIQVPDKWEDPCKDLQWTLYLFPFLTLSLAVSQSGDSQELCLASWCPLQLCLLLMRCLSHSFLPGLSSQPYPFCILSSRNLWSSLSPMFLSSSLYCCRAFPLLCLSSSLSPR